LVTRTGGCKILFAPLRLGVFALKFFDLTESFRHSDFAFNETSQRRLAIRLADSERFSANMLCLRRLQGSQAESGPVKPTFICSLK
jgi:hypothetical protein